MFFVVIVDPLGKCGNIGLIMPKPFQFVSHPAGWQFIVLILEALLGNQWK
jgi:hypothetical protein